MNIDNLSILSILASPRQNILYKVTDGISIYVLKTPRKCSDADREAYEDEYETLKNLSHPVLPKYYSFFPEIKLPDTQGHVPCILMEYIQGTPLSSIPYLTTKQLKKYILDLGNALFALLKHGVLYTDLHPGNLILFEEQIKLIDFTRAYYFLRNPYPSYTPKISYQLDQNLKGQQLLIQALTLLIVHLSEKFSIQNIPLSLIELGMHPHSGISFSEFLDTLAGKWN